MKFKFRRSRNVGADSQKHIEQLQEKLQEGNAKKEQSEATIRELQEKLDEGNTNKEQLEATVRELAKRL